MALKAVVYFFTVISPTLAILYGEYFQDVRPFMAVLLNDPTPNRTIDILCGGTIFSQRYVVTTAGCLSLENFPQLVGTDGVNIHRMVTYHKIIKRIRHPDFTGKQINNVGLVKTETSINNYDPLYSYPDNWDKPIFFYGWGCTSDSDKYSEGLKKLKLQVVSGVSPCDNGPTASKGHLLCFITDNEKDRIGNKGDIGGPIVLKARKPTEKNVIIGIMSTATSAPVDYNGKKYFLMEAANYSYYYPWLALNAV